MSAFFCVLLSCVGRGLEMGLSPVQGALKGTGKRVCSVERTTNHVTFVLFRSKMAIIVSLNVLNLSVSFRILYQSLL
jgi:hypothetical protein